MRPTTNCARRRRAPKRSDFIDRNPDGLEARVGERGRLLSGGERQRLAVARALLKDPPILILDEATSALDPVTEARLNLALDEVMKGRTTFVIAHRLATIREATRILVFRQGRIVETGTFDELTRRGGFFTELVAGAVRDAERRRCERSEAIQSAAYRPLDCFVAIALRNDGQRSRSRMLT